MTRWRAATLGVWRRLRGEPAVPPRPEPAPPAVLVGVGLDRGAPETVVVVTATTAPVTDRLTVTLGPDVAASLSPPVTFGSVAGRELGRGLDAEQAAWARQLVDRLGGLELVSPGRALDAMERARLTTARALAAGRLWTVLEDPFRLVAPERRREAARVVAGACPGRGLVLVVPDRSSAGGLEGRVVELPPLPASG